MKHTACYHLPGLFEFYELYRLFLPLFREHREYFYDWCRIGSTTKVLTRWQDFLRELDRETFSYVVPDFRLNKDFQHLETLTPAQRAKVEFLCNECCDFGCTQRKACYENVSRKIWASPARSIIAPLPTQMRATGSPGPWKTRALSAFRTFRNDTCPWALKTSSWRAGAWAAPWCWNFCCIT